MRNYTEMLVQSSRVEKKIKKIVIRATTNKIQFIDIS